MPFLNPKVLKEFTETYKKEILATRLGTYSGWLQNSVSQKIGKISSADTTKFCDYIETLIDQASKDITLWPKVICQAGRLASYTHDKSSFSWFSACAGAIRGFILEDIEKQLKTISRDSPKTLDQENAEKIKTMIDARCQATREYLNHLNAIRDLRIQLGLTDKAGDVISFDDELEKLGVTQVSDSRAILQKDLVYLADAEAIKDTAEQNEITTAIFGFSQLDSATIQLMGASHVVQAHLPSYLRYNWHAVYLRMLRQTLRLEKSDSTVVGTFIKQIESREEQKKEPAKIEPASDKGLPEKKGLPPSPPSTDELPASEAPASAVGTKDIAIQLSSAPSTLLNASRSEPEPAAQSTSNKSKPTNSNTKKLVQAGPARDSNADAISSSARPARQR